MSTSPQTPKPGQNRARFLNLNIRAKLVTATLALGAVAVGLTATVSYVISSRSLEQQAFAQLTSIGEIKKSSIEAYFQNARYDLASQAESLTVREALKELTTARHSLLSELDAAGIKTDAAFTKSIKDDVKKYYEDVLVGTLKKVRNADPGSADAYMHADLEANVLQYAFAVKNPAVVGSKDTTTEISDIAGNGAIPVALRAALAKTTYVTKHAIYHSILSTARQRFAYYDIFICDADGYVVYTNYKELDFQGNLKHGPEKDTGLGKAFAAAWELNKGASLDAHVAITDFAPYPKSYDAPATFAGCPIYDESGKKAGVFLYQLPVDKINAVMTSDKRWKETGLGESGETYLVGKDQIARTDSRFISELKLGTQKKALIGSDAKTPSETTIGALKVPTKGVERIFAGGATSTGTDIYPDYRNAPVLGYYSPLKVAGLELGILAEIDLAEAFAPAQRQAYASGIVAAVVLVLIAVFSVWFAGSFSRPIIALAQTAEKVAAGDNAARAPVGTADEIGALASTFNNMVDARVNAQEKIEADNRRLQDGIQQLLLTTSDASDGDLTVRAKVGEGALGNVSDAMNLMLENVGDLLKEVHSSSTRVASAATEIQASAEQLSQGSSRQSSEIVNTTSAVQEMAANIESVSNNANAAADAAKRASASAEDGSKAVQQVIVGMNSIRENVQSSAKKIKRLGERSMEISTIVNTIGEISAQTDMLALNAAIEAARAGEHGRGFTVVADEVRKLAERTATATKEIEKLIAGIQAETNESVSAMEQQTAQVESESRNVVGAGEALNRIREAASQSAELINEINLAAKQQVRGAGGVVKAMESVSTIAQQAQSGAVQTTRATETLTTLSTQLLGSLSKFKLATNGSAHN